MSTTSKELSIPSGPLFPAGDEIDIYDTKFSKKFEEMRESVFTGLGAQFWGIRVDESGETTSYRPDSMKYRWADLVSLVQKIPDLEEKTTKSLRRNYYDAVKYADRNMDSDVYDSLETNPIKLGITYREAFSIPQIRYPAVMALQEIGDPFIETIRTLEKWRLNKYELVSDEQGELGRETYEKFLFANGDDGLIPALGAAAIGYLKRL
jgi:hypothetical protein